MRVLTPVLFIVVVAFAAMAGLSSIGACCPPASVLVGNMSAALVAGSAPAAGVPSTSTWNNR